MDRCYLWYCWLGVSQVYSFLQNKAEVSTRYTLYLIVYLFGLSKTGTCKDPVLRNRQTHHTAGCLAIDSTQPVISPETHHTAGSFARNTPHRRIFRHRHTTQPVFSPETHHTAGSLARDTPHSRFSRQRHTTQPVLSP